MLNKTPLLHQSSGPRVFLSVSLSLPLFFRLIPWSAEALWVHFPARASKTLSRRCSAPSPHQEGAWGLCEQSKPRVGALLAFCVNQGISASFYPLLSYRRLQTTRFQSIKGPQQLIRTYHIAQGTLLNTLSWPIWEIIFKRVDTYMFNWFTLLCIWN